jgi:hypothetical protein
MIEFEALLREYDAWLQEREEADDNDDFDWSYSDEVGCNILGRFSRVARTGDERPGRPQRRARPVQYVEVPPAVARPVYQYQPVDWTNYETTITTSGFTTNGTMR